MYTLIYSIGILLLFFDLIRQLIYFKIHRCTAQCNIYSTIRSRAIQLTHSWGAVWESRWPSWAVGPNEPYGFHGRKAPCSHIGLSLSLICQLTSEDIKQHRKERTANSIWGKFIWWKKKQKKGIWETYWWHIYIIVEWGKDFKHGLELQQLNCHSCKLRARSRWYIFGRYTQTDIRVWWSEQCAKGGWSLQGNSVTPHFTVDLSKYFNHRLELQRQ